MGLGCLLYMQSLGFELFALGCDEIGKFSLGKDPKMDFSCISRVVAEKETGLRLPQVKNTPGVWEQE